MRAPALVLMLIVTAALPAAAEDTAPPQPTLGDRVAASPTTAKIKRASESAGAGVSRALGAAGGATTKAGDAVGGAFGTFDSKMTGWLGRVGLKPKPGAVGAPGPGRGNPDN